MNPTTFSAATHLSIVWGVTLAIMTLLEWQGLERDPLKKQILSPFIQRDIAVAAKPVDRVEEKVLRAGSPAAVRPDVTLQYEVEFHFNGVLFLVCFFLPVLLFHGVGWLLGRARGTGAGE